MVISHATLAGDIRKLLARTVLEARRTAEVASRQTLEALAVDRCEPHDSMLCDEGRLRLRDRLQARGRQLGDRCDRATRTQEIGRLVHEVAYEQWHRMLFARFLAENELLVEPASGVPVSLDECDDLAREQGGDRWTLAGRFAQEMLPGIFRPEDPVLEVPFPPEARLRLEELLESLPRAVFLANDSLGWTYQFWQAERKDQVNRSGVKIGADELPAVTQLFTERYMVQFLFHNTIGAWRAGKVLDRTNDQNDSGNGATEDDLRRAVRINAGGGYDFTYLRFVRDEDEAWRPAAGWFEKWPRSAAELRVLDPCCGSGHFLVEALELLVRLRMEEEGLAVQDAVCVVLRDNLHGLEIDPRCAQIAAFNVAFTAWRLVGQPCELPRLSIACCGLKPNATEAEWEKIAGRMEGPRGRRGSTIASGRRSAVATGPLQAGMADLHNVFQQASELGSLIDPVALLGGGLFLADLETVRQALPALVDRERATGGADFERAVAAQGMARAVRLLTDTYTLVVTNVPFLARGKQSATLRRFAESNHLEAKGDLATMFVARIMRWLGASGTQALVAPQNWLFLGSYRMLRERLLKRRTWNLHARLGEHAFDDPQAAGGFAVLNILSADIPPDDWQMAGFDVSATRDQTPIRATEKATLLANDAPVHLARQVEQLKNPDAVILLHPVGNRALLATIAHGHQGIATADNACFARTFWELPAEQCSGKDWSDWIWWQSTVRSTTHYGGREHVVRWQGGQGDLQRRDSVRVQGGGIWDRSGVAVSQMGTLPVTLYTGEKFDPNVAGVGPLSDDLLPSVWAFCSSLEYNRAVREINQKLNVTNATLVKVPFDLNHWRKVAQEQYPHGLPEPYSDDPTQWLFHGHPCGSVVWDEDAKRLTHGPLRTDSIVLQVAVARLLGYRWPAEHDSAMNLSDASRYWVERSAQLRNFADRDGVACLSAVAGERSAQDRVRELLATAYGQEWSATVERTLLASTAISPPPPPPPLDEWLRDHFFREHCRLFHNRPFIWHVWDGRPDGFHALVNYHRLAGPNGEGRRTLESLAYRYLGDWIERQRGEQQEGRAGADARLVAALNLQGQLERIATGEPPLDLFVRWRPLHHQPIGWEPHIDDGVRLNIRPFMRAELRTGGRKDAGILRHKPNIKWRKDRGKEPEYHKETDEHIRPRHDFPWFWSCPGTGTEQQRTDFQGGPEFDGNRWNDLHYTRAAKAAARRAAARSAAARTTTDAATNPATHA